MSKSSITVFFPVFNEEQNITPTTEKAVKVLNNLAVDWEILIIDDGSTDNTPKISDKLAEKYPGVRVIHQQNGGYGKALRSGFENAQNNLVFYTDGDGQFDFSEVVKFLEIADKYDVIVGFRMKRQDPFYRLIFAKLWAMSVFLFFGFMLKDLDCGFKMIKKKVIKDIMPLESTRGAMINAEVVIKAKSRGYKIGQVGVHHYPRNFGKPTGASIRVIIKSYFDLVKLWYQLH